MITTQTEKQMIIPEISSDWTPEDRLTAIKALIESARLRIRSGKPFKPQNTYDLLERVELIASIPAS